MRFGSGRTGLLQDSTGSVIVQDGQQDDSIQLQSLSEGLFLSMLDYFLFKDAKITQTLTDTQLGIPEDKPGVVEHVIMAVYSVFQLVVNSSYLATNIIMMVSKQKI